MSGTAHREPDARIMATPGGDRDAQLPPLVLLAGVALLTGLPVIGNKLQLIDLVCVAALPFLRKTITRNRLLGVLVGSLSLWAAGQLLADTVNGLALTISQPLVAAVTILAITPAFVHLSGGDFRRMRYIQAGNALGLAINLLLGPLGHPLGDPISWKYGYNIPISILLLALTDLWWRRGRRLPSMLALAAICVLALWTDQRSLAGVALFTALLVARRPRDRRDPTRGSTVAIGVLLVLAVLSAIMVQASSSGLLGERSTLQTRQFGTNPVAFLVNVRPEPFQEAYIFAQRPWTGWGSNPRIDGAAYAGSKQFLTDLGVVREDLDSVWLASEVPGLAEHSAVMDSLSRAGVWALPFWVLMVAVAAWAGATALRWKSSPLVVLWTILLFWDFFFSPMTGLFHITLAAYLALAVTTVRATRIKA